MRRVLRYVTLWVVVPLGLALGAVLAGVTPAVPAARQAAADGSGPAPPPGADAQVPAVARSWPLGGRPVVLRGWEPPATVYGPGHRGVDLRAAPGTPVRAVAPGRVSFAGRVAGRGVVSVELSGTGLRTTYEPVAASVEKGARVRAGDVVGAVEAVETVGTHCPEACVHWGLRSGDAYLNPLELLPPWLLEGGPSRLLPVLGVPLPA